jgi:hypothetical protein
MYGFLLLIYVFCFFAMFAMFRWYMLVGGVLAVGAFLAWMMSSMKGANGPAIFGATMIIVPAFVGFISGLVGQVIIMLTRRFAKAKISAMYIGALAFVLGPVFFYASLKISEQRHIARNAPPSAACMANPRRAILGGVALSVPLAPSISVDTRADKANLQDYKSLRSFEINQRARQFCAETEKEPVTITRLTMYFQRSNAQSAFCKLPSNYIWRALTCTNAGYGKRSALPDEVNFYAIGIYNAPMMFAFDADNVADIARLEKSGGGTMLGSGVMRYTGEHDTSFIQRITTGQTIIAKCYKTEVQDVAKSEGLYCTTGFRLSGSVGAVIKFRSSKATVVDDWQKAINGSKTIWQSLLSSYLIFAPSLVLGSDTNALALIAEPHDQSHWLSAS